MRHTLVCLAFAAVLRGQPVPMPPDRPAAATTASTLRPGSVSGTVTNSVSGEPVKKAIVTIRSTTQPVAYESVTDAAGNFSIANVEPGRYRTMAGAQGYLPESSLDPRSPAAGIVAVAEEQNVTGVAVKMKPLAVVGGRVVDDDGDPIAGASVRAVQVVYNLGEKQLLSSASAMTNDLGEYQILNLFPFSNQKIFTPFDQYFGYTWTRIVI